MEVLESFIGRGLVFPIKIDKEGRPTAETGFPLIRASILHILHWPMAHRYFNERFGSRLEECLEEPLDNITVTIIKHFIREALGKWERRLKITQITVTQESDTAAIYIKLVYRVSSTKQTDTFIFPFYKNIIY